MRQLASIFAAALLLILTAACGNNGCEEVRETFCYAEVTATSGLVMTHVDVWGIGHRPDTVVNATYDRENDTTVRDTVLADVLMLTASNPKSLEFILRPDTNATSLRLKMTINDNGDFEQYEDTIHLRYTTTPYFLNMECGCSAFFTLEEVSATQHILKKVTLKGREITNEESVNLLIEY